MLGFQNGTVRCYVLLEKKDMSQLGAYGTRWLHDRQYGDISKVSFSYDDRYLFTTGLDGNVFVCQMPETARLLLGRTQQAVEPAPLPISDTVCRLLASNSTASICC